MTIGIAATCQHEGSFAVVLCADFQGTRGSLLKADDTDKIRDFDNAAILFANDVDAGAEFSARFEELVREFNSVEKKIGDIDLRFGIYLSKIRDLVRAFIRERANHLVSTKFAISLDEFHSADGHKKFPLHRYDEIFEQIKSVDLGAEFIVAYMGDNEPILIRVFQDGHVSLEENDFIAIGSGEPIAMAAFGPEYGGGAMSLQECIIRVYQAKKWAEKNPYVGELTAIRVILKGGQEFELSDEFWRFLSTVERPRYIVEDDLERWEQLQQPVLDLERAKAMRIKG